MTPNDWRRLGRCGLLEKDELGPPLVDHPAPGTAAIILGAILAVATLVVLLVVGA